MTLKNKTCNIILVVTGIIIVFLIIPFTLNCLLQKESCLKSVIGGTESPKVWLAFWGSYLAALGTLFAAGVALINSEKERKDNRLFHRLSTLRQVYFNMEKEINDIINLHSIFKLTEIYRALPNLINANNFQQLFLFELRNSVTIAEKLNDFYECHTFLKAFRDVNIYYVDKSIDIKEILIRDIEINEKGKMLEEFLMDVSNDPKRKVMEDSLNIEGRNFLSQCRINIVKYNKLLEN